MAQVSINFVEIPIDWGIESTYWAEGDTLSGIPVQLGTPGGGNTWDFSGVSSANEFSQMIVPASATPYGNEFPDANLVLEADDMIQFGLPGEGYMFFELSQNSLLLDGIGIEFEGTPVPVVFENPVTWAEMPLDFGDDWLNSFLFQYEFDSAGMEYRLDLEGTFDMEVDAYGDLSVPFGDTEALRLRNDINIDITLYLILFGFPIEVYNQGMSYISYFWVAEDMNMTALVMSQEGETNPNFTNASTFSVMSDITPGLYSADLIPANPPVQIPAGGGNIEFTLTMSNNMQEPGTFTAWTGAYLPSGLFYGPILIREVTLNSGVSIVRPLTQVIPANAPAGTYYYVLELNEGGFGEAQSRGGFSFEKLGADGYASANEGWEIYGWDDEIALAENATPSGFELYNAYPNPFNASTTLSFQLYQDGDVSLRVFDITGREAAELLEGYMNEGSHQLTWNAERVASGVYFAVMESGGIVQTQKLILVK